MSKRKNLHKYVQAVANWNRILGMDTHGDWETEEARRKAEEDPRAAMAALAAAVEECIDGFKINPSCPALDTCLGLIGEAADVGLPEPELRTMADRVETVWKREREISTNPGLLGKNR